jgi:hypothetical protein
MAVEPLDASPPRLRLGLHPFLISAIVTMMRNRGICTFQHVAGPVTRSRTSLTYATLLGLKRQGGIRNLGTERAMMAEVASGSPWIGSRLSRDNLLAQSQLIEHCPLATLTHTPKSVTSFSWNAWGPKTHRGEQSRDCTRTGFRPRSLDSRMLARWTLSKHSGEASKAGKLNDPSYPTGPRTPGLYDIRGKGGIEGQGYRETGMWNHRNR